MIGKKSMFRSLSLMFGGVVTFGGNKKVLIAGVGKVCIHSKGVMLYVWWGGHFWRESERSDS